MDPDELLAGQPAVLIDLLSGRPAEAERRLAARMANWPEHTRRSGHGLLVGLLHARATLAAGDAERAGRLVDELRIVLRIRSRNDRSAHRPGESAHGPGRYGGGPQLGRSALWGLPFETTPATGSEPAAFQCTGEVNDEVRNRVAAAMRPASKGTAWSS